MDLRMWFCICVLVGQGAYIFLFQFNIFALIFNFLVIANGFSRSYVMGLVSDRSSLWRHRGSVGCLPCPPKQQTKHRSCLDSCSQQVLKRKRLNHCRRLGLFIRGDWKQMLLHFLCGKLSRQLSVVLGSPVPRWLKGGRVSLHNTLKVIGCKAVKQLITG